MSDNDFVAEFKTDNNFIFGKSKQNVLNHANE